MQINLTDDIISNLSPWLISIAETGSQTLPWIKNPHDRDLLFFTQGPATEEQRAQFKQFRNHWSPGGECWMLEDINECVYLFCYQYKFLNPIWGNEFPYWDIFDPDIACRIKQYLVHWATINNSLSYKLWYHVLTLIYLYQNKDYYLTTDQQLKVQECHDKKMSLETYNYIINNLNIWAEEFGRTKISLDRVLLE